MASAARMVLKPSSHSSITGRRRCSHSNVAGGWTLLRTLGAPLTVARCSSGARRCERSVPTRAGHRYLGRASGACGTLEHERGPQHASDGQTTTMSAFAPVCDASRREGRRGDCGRFIRLYATNYAPQPPYM